MRTLVRTFLNLALIVTALAGDAWLTTAKVYQHAGPGARIALMVTPVVVAFVIDCFVLTKVVPKKAASRRPVLPYATTRR
jgi:hypothetical protein